MNRHMIDYAALPSYPLGTPIRQETEKPEPKWEPSGTPGYERRTVNGKVETRPIRLDPEPAKAAAIEAPRSQQFAPPAKVMMPWRSDAPAATGWYRSSCFSGDADASMASYWAGVRWSHYLSISCADLYNRSGGAVDDKGWTKVWMEPRLDDLKAPQ